MSTITISCDGVHCKKYLQQISLFCLITFLQVVGKAEINILKNGKLHLRQIANLIEAINVVTEGIK